MNRRRSVRLALVLALLANLLNIAAHAPTPVAASGGASFGTATEFTMPCCLSGGGLPHYPRATVITDVNRDGIPDYLVAN